MVTAAGTAEAPKRSARPKASRGQRPPDPYDPPGVIVVLQQVERAPRNDQGSHEPQKAQHVLRQVPLFHQPPQGQPKRSFAVVVFWYRFLKENYGSRVSYRSSSSVIGNRNCLSDVATPCTRKLYLMLVNTVDDTHSSRRTKMT